MSKLDRAFRCAITATLAITVLLGMTGCGATEAPPPEPTSPPPAAEEPTQVVEEPTEPPPPTEPPMEDEPLHLTLSVQFEIGNADPAVFNDWPGGVYRRAVYDTLVELHGNPVRVEPGLAETWDISDDLTEWTFHLRDNASFHDGSPVTADAVKYSFDRQMAMQTGYAWMWADITTDETVTVIDDQTVKFTLTKSFSPFLQTLGYLAVLNPTLVKEHEADGDWGTNWLLDHEAGSGPFHTTRWEPGTLYEFERFANYWKSFPCTNCGDVFRYMVYREPGPAALGLQTGDISWSSYIEEEEAVQLAASGEAEAVVRPSMTLDYIFMNTQGEGPIGDANVRKALAYAYDYAAIPEAIYAMEPTNSIMPLGLPGAIEIADAQRTDLDLAKEALAQSDWPDGGFELDYVFIGGFAPEETAGLILIESLQKLNITVNMIPKTWSEMVEMCASVETTPDMINIYTGAPYPDPYPFIYQSWGPTTSYDYNTCSWFFDAQVANLLEQASSERDETKRRELYAEIQEILWDARFGIVLGNAAHPEGRNLHWNPIEPMNPLYGYFDYPYIYEYTP